MFAKRDRVFDVRRGFGTVQRIGHWDGFPVLVEFDNGKCGRYSIDGFQSIGDVYPALFPKHHPVADEMESVRRPEPFEPDFPDFPG